MRLEITGPIPPLPVLEKALEHHQAVTSLPGQGHGTCQPPGCRRGVTGEQGATVILGGFVPRGLWQLEEESPAGDGDATKAVLCCRCHPWTPAGRAGKVCRRLLETPSSAPWG